MEKLLHSMQTVLSFIYKWRFTVHCVVICAVTSVNRCIVIFDGIMFNYTGMERLYRATMYSSECSGCYGWGGMSWLRKVQGGLMVFMPLLHFQSLVEPITVSVIKLFRWLMVAQHLKKISLTNQLTRDTNTLYLHWLSPCV